MRAQSVFMTSNVYSQGLTPGSQELIAKYGRNKLLHDSAAILQRLRGTDDESVRKLIDILQSTGCGMEQEALLLA